MATVTPAEQLPGGRYVSGVVNLYVGTGPAH
jgi:hypothetical protein